MKWAFLQTSDRVTLCAHQKSEQNAIRRGDRVEQKLNSVLSDPQQSAFFCSFRSAVEQRVWILAQWNFEDSSNHIVFQK